MYLKTFEDMQHTSVFFMLKPARAVYAFLLAVCGAVVVLLVWGVFLGVRGEVDCVGGGRGRSVAAIICGDSSRHTIRHLII